MSLKQETVKDIVDDAVSGSFNIPEFQRGFVWRSDQVRDLIESMHRDYPIGAMLLWDASDYDGPRTAKGAVISNWIVDGQQRTTALCVLFGRKPYWWPDAQSWNALIERVDVLVNLHSAGEQLEFALANPVRRKDPAYASVRQILCCKDEEACTTLASDFVAKLGSVPGAPAFMKEFIAVNGVVTSLWNVRKRDVPIISVKHELEDVAEIFARLNQAGTRVTEADVVVALIAAANPSWVREEFLTFSSDLAERGYELEPGVYIRAITGAARGTARLKDVDRTFWTDELPLLWTKMKQTMVKTVKLLSDRGILSTQLLPSRNSLIPLFAFQSRFGDTTPFDRVFRWFLLANADGRYSGASVTSLTQDVAIIRNAASGDDAIHALLNQLRVAPDFAPDRFFEDYSRDRFGRLLVYLLLFEQQALDWVSRVRVGFDKVDIALNTGFLPEWHHIFPRAFLKAAGRNEQDMNLLANLTVLNEDTNRRKLQSKPPEKYIAEYGITDTDLLQHLMPTSGRPYAAEGYDDFLTARAQRLSEAANHYFSRLAS